MSLPIARARRKNVPSIQRSPNSSTRSHSRTQSSKPRVVMSQASWSSPTSHSSLTSRISEATRARSSSRVSSPAPARRRRRHAAVHAGLAGRRRARRQVVDVADLEAERGGDLVQRRAAAGPQLAVLAVAEELVGVARRARARVEHGLAVVDDQHGVAGLVAGEVGVRGVGAEAVVGVVGRAPCRCRPGAPAARPGTPRRARARRSAYGRRSGAAAGRARGRPSPSRMKAA